MKKLITTLSSIMLIASISSSVKSMESNDSSISISSKSRKKAARKARTMKQTSINYSSYPKALLAHSLSARAALTSTKVTPALSYANMSQKNTRNDDDKNDKKSALEKVIADKAFAENVSPLAAATTGTIDPTPAEATADAYIIVSAPSTQSNASAASEQNIETTIETAVKEKKSLATTETAKDVPTPAASAGLFASILAYLWNK